MDCIESQDVEEPITEYEEAAERFERAINSGDQYQGANCSSTTYTDIVNDIVKKLCKCYSISDKGTDSSLFYDVIYQADFLQLKTEVEENFYTELWQQFILSNLIEDILRNMNKLNNISHIKKYLVQACFKILHIVPIFHRAGVILKYSKEDRWNDIDLSLFDCIQLKPCAYKIMLARKEFNFFHLNFIFELLEVKKLTLCGCNLKRKLVPNLFHGLKLEYLDLAECGTSINELLQMNIPGSLGDLKYLDVSRNILLQDTLTCISCLPLKTLKLSACIKRTGKMVNHIWFAEKFDVTVEEKMTAIDIDVLWMKEYIGATIEVLDLSSVILSVQHFETVLGLNCKDLDISGSIDRLSILNVTFPESLKVLRARKNVFSYKEFEKLCSLRLERLELDYFASVGDDFNSLSLSPLVSSLKELLVSLPELSEKFIAFISRFRLKYFNCELPTLDNYIDSFIIDFPEHRKCLDTFIISGPGLDLTDEFFIHFRQLNLREMSISLACSDKDFGEILSCKNLQKTLKIMKLTEKEVKDDALLELVKFEKLEHLSFSFSGNVTVEYLQKVVEIKTLKQLELEAVVKGKLDLNMARLLCVAPVKKLLVLDDYCSSISEEAFEFLSQSENISRFCTGVSKLYIRTVIKKNMAEILKQVDWESVILDQCSTNDNSLQLILESERLSYTLDEFHTIDSEVPWEQLSHLRLSKLKIEHIDIPSTFLAFIKESTCSEFVRYLFLENRSVDCSHILETNLSEVDTF